LEEVLDEWRFWREVDLDPNTGAHAKLREVMQSFPPGWIRRDYSQHGWIPLITDKTGNYIGVDMNPAEGGAVGQVIVFGRDFDRDPALPWASEILTGRHSRNATVRIERLYEAAKQQQANGVPNGHVH